MLGFKKIWGIIKNLFLIIFIIHTCWFTFFIFKKFPVEDFTVKNLKTKVLSVIAVMVIFILIYYFLLRRIFFIRRTAVVVKEFFFIGYISSSIYLLAGLIINPPITLTQIANLLKGYELKRDYVSYKNTGYNIKLAVIASEDQLFPDHDGFDLKAIKRAIKYNKRHPEKQRGGSTISQQTAKNFFLWQGGGFLRKGIEVYFTFTIEKIWTKKIILERYLNIAEMGKGIFGIQAAAKNYFNKNAADLTRTEAAQIAACLPNPKKLSVKPLSAYVAARANAIEKQMGFLESDPDIQEIIK